MSFLNPGLVSLGVIAALIALPIIIHLINLMRYRRVQWAAMEFLLAAHKKSSTWVLLKQLLLLLMRIAALLALLMVLAQVLYKADLSEFLAGVVTHHVVVVDNTGSMGDTAQNKTLLDVAKEEALKIGAAAARSPGRHTLTLISYSQAHTQAPLLLNQRAVDRNFATTLQSALEQIQPTEMSVAPKEVLDAIAKLDPPENEKRRIYLLSDFRTRDWGTTDDIKADFQDMTAKGALLHLVQCTKSEHDNLAISALKPRAGVLAANISVMMDVSVTNHGKNAREDVSVIRIVDGVTLPAVKIPAIGPGKTETGKFEVQFDRPGGHTVTVQLQGEDPIAADNFRHAVLEVQEQVPVLIVDGVLAGGVSDVRGLDTEFLSFALKPGDLSVGHTGVAPEVASPEQLSSPKFNLSKFKGIFLCNFARLSDQAIENLENYVRAGGGLAIFAGENFQARFINEKLYRDGQGLFPARVASQYDLIVDRVEKSPDWEPDIEHPVFRMFGGQGGKFLEKIDNWRYFAVSPDWKPDDKSTTKVIARLRNKAPLAIEHNFENAGRVIAFMTTAGPGWNNWSREPTYLIGIQELRNYLAPPETHPSHLVGMSKQISESLDADKYDPTIHWKSASLELKQQMSIANGDDRKYTLPVPDITKAGIYELQLTTRDRKIETKHYVFNVAPEEGNLALLPTEKLIADYAKDNKSVQVLQPGAIGGQIDDSARSNLSEMLLYGLILLLILEQMLAYSASYHPPALKGVA